MSMNRVEHATHLMRRIGGQNVDGRTERAAQRGRARPGRNEVDQDLRGCWVCHYTFTAVRPSPWRAR